MTTGEYKQQTFANNMTKLILMPEECIKVDQIDKWMWFSMNEHAVMKVLVSDPNLQLSYRQNTVGVSGDTLSTFSGETSFNIRTTILKRRPEKNSCKEYVSPDSYAKCIEKGKGLYFT